MHKCFCMCERILGTDISGLRLSITFVGSRDMGVDRVHKKDLERFVGHVQMHICRACIWNMGYYEW